MPPLYDRDHKAMLQSVRVCLSVSFPDSSSSLDGDMRASPFQTHSIGDSTLGYPASKCCQRGAYRFAEETVLTLQQCRGHTSTHTRHTTCVICRRVTTVSYSSKLYIHVLPLHSITNAAVRPTMIIIGPIPWGHSGPLFHALSLSSLSLASWTSMRRRRATVPLATPGEWA